MRTYSAKFGIAQHLGIAGFSSEETDHSNRNANETVAYYDTLGRECLPNGDFGNFIDNFDWSITPSLPSPLTVLRILGVSASMRAV